LPPPRRGRPKPVKEDTLVLKQTRRIKLVHGATEASVVR
jgi:hypothetical protein